MRSAPKNLAAALLMALAPAALAQAGSPLDATLTTFDRTGAERGQALVATKIASSFTGLAGSEENALALVNALRTGEAVQLTYAPAGTATTPRIGTLDPPTGRMGWGNVKISLALAQDQLARLGITHPTAEQLGAALNGGDIVRANADGTTTSTTLRGVLQMRAEGMGWGRIAQAGGTKVGPVVSRLKTANTKVAAIPPTSTTTAATAAPTTTKASFKPSTPLSNGKSTVTTAAGKSTGMTTAAGRTDAVGGKHGLKGIMTATGAANPAASRGLTTAEGAITATRGNGNAAGRGAVSTAHGNAGGHNKDHGGGKGKGG